jgi:protein NrfC
MAQFNYVLEGLLKQEVSSEAERGGIMANAVAEKEFALSKGYLLIDTKKCSGCMSCMMACTLAHEGKIDLTHARIQIKKNVFGTYPDDDIEQYVCKQCADAPCVAACRFEALIVDSETGVRVIDNEKCTGCRMCVKACKYSPSRIVYDYDTRKALKCDLCMDTPFWNETGGPRGKQACINACSLCAITFSRDLPENEDAYEVNLRTSLHYARAMFPIDDAGMQSPREALEEAGLRLVGKVAGVYDSAVETEVVTEERR